MQQKHHICDNFFFKGIKSRYSSKSQKRICYFDFSGNSTFLPTHFTSTTKLDVLVSACECKQGYRTVDLCAHRAAVLYFLALNNVHKDPFEITKNTPFHNSVFKSINDITKKKRKGNFMNSKCKKQKTTKNQQLLSQQTQSENETTESNTESQIASNSESINSQSENP